MSAPALTASAATRKGADLRECTGCCASRGPQHPSLVHHEKIPVTGSASQKVALSRLPRTPPNVELGPLVVHRSCAMTVYSAQIANGGGETRWRSTRCRPVLLIHGPNGHRARHRRPFGAGCWVLGAKCGGVRVPPSAPTTRTGQRSPSEGPPVLWDQLSGGIRSGSAP